jgi:signal transduction histidine kinase
VPGTCLVGEVRPVGDQRTRPGGEGPLSPRWRRWGRLWVLATVPVTTVAGGLAHSVTTFALVEVFLAFGLYVVPGIVVGHLAVTGAAPTERLGYRLLHVGLLVTLGVGGEILAGLATGWGWLLSLTPAGFAAAGAALVGGLVVVARRRAGQQALSVDVAETLASVVAVAAPLAVLWWPSIVAAPDAWFTLSASVAFLFTVAAAYWVALLWVRLGPRPWDALEGWKVAAGAFAALVGTVTAGLHVALGVSEFTLPTGPLAGLCALCASTYLLIPLHAPVRMRDGFAGAPPEQQVRGGWLPTVGPLAGIAALLAATAAVAGERSWAVPFAFAIVTLLALLAAVRQVASMRETRSLYRHLEVTSAERRALLAQLLERSVDDRRAVVEQLHSQAMSAYASFTALAATDRPAAVVAQASAVVGADLRQRAESLHELVRSMRPRDGGRPGPQLIAPLRAYVATLYGERPAPALTVVVGDDLVLDWVVETVVLLITQEALQNVWRHSGAGAVEVDIRAGAGVVLVRVVDDGDGFDGATVPEAGGIATMRASAAVVDGEVSIASSPGRGTTVEARLGTHAAAPATVAGPSALRAVPPPLGAPD